MELDDLRSFIGWAEAGGISAAARVLDQPKSSVSRSISRLEGVLGVVLFERAARLFRLTDAGTAFLPHAKRVLLEADEAASAIGRFGAEPRGLVRVKATYSITEKLISPMLSEFLEKYPAIKVALNVENRRTDMLAEEADLVINVSSG